MEDFSLIMSTCNDSKYLNLRSVPQVLIFREDLCNKATPPPRFAPIRGTCIEEHPGSVIFAITEVSSGFIQVSVTETMSKLFSVTKSTNSVVLFLIDRVLIQQKLMLLKEDSLEEALALPALVLLLERF